MFLSCADFSLSASLPTRLRIEPTQLIDKTRRHSESDLSISLSLVDSQAMCDSQTPPSGQSLRSDSFVPSSVVISEIKLSFSAFSLTRRGFEQSKIIVQTRTILKSDLPFSCTFANSLIMSVSPTPIECNVLGSLVFMCSISAGDSETRESDEIAATGLSASALSLTGCESVHSISFHQTRTVGQSDSLISLIFVSSLLVSESMTPIKSDIGMPFGCSSVLVSATDFSVSGLSLTGCESAYSGSFRGTRAAAQSDFPISFISVNSMPVDESATPLKSDVFVTSRAFTESEMIHRTGPFRSSQHVIHSQLFSLSLAVFQSLLSLSDEPHETDPLILSPQWSYSAQIRSSISAFLPSRSLKATIAIFSNLFLHSHGCRLSGLLPTLEFATLLDDELKVSVGSVRLVSGTVSGGALIGLITIFSLCFVFHRRQKTSPIDEEPIDEFDLQTEHCDEEEPYDDDDVFDLQNSEGGAVSDDLSVGDSWVPGRIRRGDNLCFDGEESF
jgi:hypothetical protein